MVVHLTLDAGLRTAAAVVITMAAGRHGFQRTPCRQRQFTLHS